MQTECLGLLLEESKIIHLCTLPLEVFVLRTGELEEASGDVCVCSSAVFSAYAIWCVWPCGYAYYICVLVCVPVETTCSVSLLAGVMR